MRYAHLCGEADFIQAKGFSHLRILRAVSPSVHHYHFVALGVELAQVFLVFSKRAKALKFAAFPNSERVAVCARPLAFGYVYGIYAGSY